ncbi:MAG: hypothetical protein GXO74_01395 [Calditrichaeota bacterium]|nr:hypothetical protein [Calditrichota bacterium]
MDCQTCTNLIDEYFDRRLSRKTRKKIERHLAICSECRSDYRNYEKLFEDLKNLGPASCPQEVIQSVNEIIGFDKEEKTSTKFFAGLWLRVSILHRPLRFAGAFIVFIVVGALLFSQWHKPEPNLREQYSQAEIEQAANQVKLALAYVNAATSHAGEILQKQVFPEDVIKPMKSSLQQALQPLLDGGKS